MITFRAILLITLVTLVTLAPLAHAADWSKGSTEQVRRARIIAQFDRMIGLMSSAIPAADKCVEALKVTVFNSAKFTWAERECEDFFRLNNQIENPKTVARWDAFVAHPEVIKLRGQIPQWAKMESLTPQWVWYQAQAKVLANVIVIGRKAGKVCR